MTVITAVSVIVMSHFMGMSVTVPAAIGMDMIVYVGRFMLVLVLVIMGVPDAAATSVIMLMGVAMVGTVLVRMAAHGDLLSGLKIKDGGPGLVPASAMSTHQATSCSSSMLLIFSSSPCNRVNRRDPQLQGVNSVSAVNSEPQASQRARPSIRLISSVAPSSMVPCATVSKQKAIASGMTPESFPMSSVTR
jgi:hypothetical protein